MFEPTLVLVYGTLKKPYGNHRVLGNSKYICDAITEEDYYSMFDGGFPFVSASKIHERHGRIKGELYLVEDENIMSSLDSLEGVPYMYVHERVVVKDVDSGMEHQAVMYVASGSTDEELRYDNPMQPNEEGILEWERKIKWTRKT